MDLPKKLNEAIQNFSASLKHADIINNSKIISDRYRFETGSNKRLLKSSTEAVSYAISRMPATYSACYSALEHTFNLIQQKPKNILDVGAGTGAASWAVSQLTDLNSITCLERESAMLELGGQLMKYISIDNKNIKWQQYDLLKDSIAANNYDLVIASYVLNELTLNDQKIAVKKLWNATDDLLIIVEPGTPKNYEQIKNLRKILISLGGNLIAPCAHCGECNIKVGDWCSFSVRVNRSKIHMQSKSGIMSYEDEKFTYLAFSKKQKPKQITRVIRHPQYRPKVVELEVCSKDGIKSICITKSNKIYKKARDLKHGDLFADDI